MIDFSRASEIAISNIETFLPGGKWNGHEYIVRNPRRNDTKPGSFKINRDGQWSDFATDERGGDGVSLWAYVFGVKQSEAARQILERFDGLRPYHPPTEKRREDYVQIMPVPEGVKLPAFGLKDLGLPAKTWEYRAENGALNFVVARYKTADGGKTIRPFIYCKGPDGRLGWRARAPEDPRPLYGLDKLKDNLPILIVEGEKCAELGARVLAGSFTVMTWQGGSMAVSKTDWTPLQGREVTIWPDNDDAGQKAANQIEKIIGKAKIVKIPNGKPDGWDIADAINEGMDRDGILNTITPTELQRPAFRAIGFYERTFYFLSGRTSSVIPITSSELRQNQLLTLAPLSYWQHAFANGKNGPNWTEAADHLIQLCQEAGPYDAARVRGRGVWLDEGRVVVHNGDTVTVGGKTIPVDSFDSRFIYERRPSINIRTVAPLTVDAAKNTVDIFYLLNWDKPQTAYLAAGWCAISSICGSLEWRPHTYLTGQAGSGKSWTLQHIIKPLLGSGALFRLGKSTEAGIRQDLANDAIPIVIDEFESDEKEQAGQLQQVLTLMRQASSEGDIIVKGSTNGKPVKYKVSSAFMLSSIGVSVQHHADESRVTTLSLVTDNSDAGRLRFQRLQKKVDETLTEEYCAAFRARMVAMLPTIKQNAKTLARAVAKRLSSQRVGDQLGTLMAGALAIIDDGLISDEAAEHWLASFDLTDEEAKHEANDEEMCLQSILQTMIRVEQHDFTVGELIAAATERRYVSGLSPDEAGHLIKRYGMRILPDNTVAFASSHSGLKNMLRATPWSHNYARIIRRIPGATSGPQTRFTDGVVQRVTKIPLDKILKNDGK